MTKFPKREVVEFWRCSRGHRHTTFARASTCEDWASTQQRRAADRENERTRYSERCRQAYEARETGVTWKQIGITIGRQGNPEQPISGQQAHWLAHCWYRKNILTLRPAQDPGSRSLESSR